MAVVLDTTPTSAALSWAASTTATATSVDIGTAAWNRLVVVGVTVEADVDLSSCTIGGITATVGPQARDTGGTPDNVSRFFYAVVPTGTTANIVVTASGSITQTGRLTAWNMTGVEPVHSDSNTNQGSAATLTLTGVTVPTGGAGFWVFNNATTGTVVNWTNATERDDTSVGNYRHSAADTTTAGTLTITADGATAAQSIVGISFSPTAHNAWPLTQGIGVRAAVSKMSLAVLAASGLIYALAPFVDNTVTPDKWLMRFDAPPPKKVAPQGHHLFAPPAMPPPAVVPAINVNIDAPTVLFNRTLQYQSWAWCPQPIAEAPVDVGWLTQSNKLPQRRRALQHTQPTFVSPVAPTVSIEWMQPFTKAAQAPSVDRPAASFVYVPEVVVPDNNITGTGWHVPFRGARGPEHPGYRSGALTAPFEVVVPTEPEPTDRITVSVISPLVLFGRTLQYQSFAWCPQPSEAAPDNNVVGTGWWRPLTQAAQKRPFARTQPLLAARAPDNNVVGTGWWRPFTQAAPQRPFARTQPVYAIQVAPLNTITGMGWWQPLGTAVQARPVWPTQPFYGYPYVLAEHVVVTFGIGHAQIFRRGFQYQATTFVPHVVPVNLTTTLEWLQPFKQAVPISRPARMGGTPFVPAEATIQNTTNRVWPLTFGENARPVARTAPQGMWTFGYPYDVQANIRTPWDWQINWPDRAPRFWWKAKPYQPFVPREAVLENTTNRVWPLTFGERSRPIPSPAPQGMWAFGYPYQSVEITVTVEWLVPLSRAVLVPRTAPESGSPFVPKEAVLENTTNKVWPLTQGLRARPIPRARLGYVPFVPREATRENTTNKVWPLTQGERARPIPRAPLGYVPFVPSQPVVRVTFAWPLTETIKARPVPRPAKLGFYAFGHPYAQPPNTQTIDKWQQPLSRAVPIPQAAPPGWTWWGRAISFAVPPAAAKGVDCVRVTPENCRVTFGKARIRATESGRRKHLDRRIPDKRSKRT